MFRCLAPVLSLLAREITTTTGRYPQRKQKPQNIADPAQPRNRKSEQKKEQPNSKSAGAPVPNKFRNPRTIRCITVQTHTNEPPGRHKQQNIITKLWRIRRRKSWLTLVRPNGCRANNGKLIRINLGWDGWSQIFIPIAHFLIFFRSLKSKWRTPTTADF